MNDKSGNEIDKYVGHRLFLLRTQKGLFQQKIGDITNVSVQQIQKYEQGINRISAGKLFLIAKALGVQVSYFYEGYDRLVKIDKVDIPNEEIYLSISRNLLKIKNIEYKKALNIIVKGLSKGT